MDLIMMPASILQENKQKYFSRWPLNAFSDTQVYVQHSHLLVPLSNFLKPKSKHFARSINSICRSGELQFPLSTIPIQCSMANYWHLNFCVSLIATVNCSQFIFLKHPVQCSCTKVLHMHIQKHTQHSEQEERARQQYRRGTIIAWFGIEGRKEAQGPKVKWPPIPPHVIYTGGEPERPCHSFWFYTGQSL